MSTQDSRAGGSRLPRMAQPTSTGRWPYATAVVLIAGALIARSSLRPWFDEHPLSSVLPGGPHRRVVRRPRPGCAGNGAVGAGGHVCLPAARRVCRRCRRRPPVARVVRGDRAGHFLDQQPAAHSRCHIGRTRGAARRDHRHHRRRHHRDRRAGRSKRSILARSGCSAIAESEVLGRNVSHADAVAVSRGARRLPGALP